MDGQDSFAESPPGLHPLVSAVDTEIELLRERIRRVFKETPGSDTLAQSSMQLEDLVVDLREANEHLVIASLDANSRETKTAESHRQQTLFLSMLAHELRNPLAPIAMSVELLEKVPGTPPAVQLLQKILQRQTTHLIRLVDDLMDATRINSGKLKIKKTGVWVSQFIEHAVEMSLPQLNLRRQQLHLDLPAEPLGVLGDPVRLSQLLSNLLLNASKFSAERTSMYLCVRREADRIVLSVKDEGIGIPLQRQPFIFDLFDQGGVGEGLMAKGLGIGLSLVRTVAQLHGGTVAVRSGGAGQGSEFIVSLPLAESAMLDEGFGMDDQAPESTGLALSRPLQTKRVLLIDDNPDINQTLGEFLKEEGHDVDFALDGRSGLQMAQASRYDVICCDIGLPEMSGREVARRLRDRKSTALLIAISGYDQPAQCSGALEAGFHHYLVKPISVEKLLALIADA